MENIRIPPDWYNLVDTINELITEVEALKQAKNVSVSKKPRMNPEELSAFRVENLKKARAARK